MRKLTPLLVGASALLLLLNARAAVAYPDPPDGWTYIYNGDQRIVGDDASFSWLDGTWSHNNGSDAFDGSELGGEFDDVSNRPGGISLLEQDGVTFLRLQSPGDPRDYGYSDPSNRKVYLGHDINGDTDPAVANELLDNGVTLTFRGRIPTAAKGSVDGSFLIDPLHRDGQQASGTQPYPADGDGYVTSDGGKGNFVIRQGGPNPGAIAFSFTQSTDTPGGDPNSGVANFAGLTFNEFNGNQTTGDVDFGDGTATNLVSFDPTDWHELYIVIQRDPADIGTHEAFVWWDGNLTPIIFKVTTGDGKDVEVDNYLAIGGSATPQNWALDIDWYGFKDEIVWFPGAVDNLPPRVQSIVPAPNQTFYSAASGITAQVTTISTNIMPPSGFVLNLNGQDLSSQLNVGGTDQNRTVTYTGLEDNKVYLGELIIRDQEGRSTTNALSFDTFVEAGTITVESEDYNFQNGQYIDDPVPGEINVPGTLNVDYFDTTTTPGSENAARGDYVDGDVSTDVARDKFLPGDVDYAIIDVQAGEWLNWTRTFPGGRQRVFLRASATTAQPMRLDRVSGATGQGQTLSTLGTFSVLRTGNLNNYRYVELSDAFGDPLTASLSGVQTLRLTAPVAAGDVQHNFLFIAPAPSGTPVNPAVAAASPAPNAAAARPDAPLDIVLVDGSDPVDTGSIVLKFDGAEVTPQTSDTTDGVRVTYQPALLASGSTHDVEIAFNGLTKTWSFTTATYITLPPSLGTDPGTGAEAGMKWRTHQLDEARENSVAAAEQQLAGDLGPSIHDPFGPTLGIAWTDVEGTDGYFNVSWVNFEIEDVAVGPQAVGHFNANAPAPENVGDDYLPGIPGTTGVNTYIATEALAYIDFAQTGLYEMVVSSDDGFRVTMGNRDTPTYLTLGEYDGGRSSADTAFFFNVDKAGVYLFRLLYFQGDGGCDVEWFTVNPDGSRALVGGAQPGALVSYRTRTVAEPEIPQEPPSIAGISLSGTDVILTWSGGAAPYTIQTKASLSDAAWTDAGTTSQTSITLPIQGDTAFYQVISQNP